jgi:hypothetical protein
MKLSDRIRRWWSPAKWRDEHTEISDGEGFALSAEQTLADTAGAESSITKGIIATGVDSKH